jgi:hypothetical protein
MKVDSLANEPIPIGFSGRNVSGGVAAMAKEILASIHLYRDEEDKISYWQLIFLQSKANDCSYRGEDLPHMRWQWPSDTWFQEQLSHHRRDLKSAS